MSCNIEDLEKRLADVKTINEHLSINDQIIKCNYETINKNNKTIDTITNSINNAEAMKEDTLLRFKSAQYHYVAWLLAFLLLSGLFIHKIIKK